MPNSFFHRILGIDPAINGPKIAWHYLRGAMAEHVRGKLTGTELRTILGITPDEETDFANLLTRVTANQESYTFSGPVVLTNVGATYDATDASAGLPFLYIQAAGVSRVDMEVRHRKVTVPNTVHYQLWNDTDGVSVLDSDATSGANNATTGSLSDSAGTGDRNLTAGRVFAAPLAPGLKRIRVRCRSTGANDDPVFLQAALLVWRVDILSADVLEDVGFLAEMGARYTDVTTLKARLGVA